jgi:hypothetical protein
MHLYSPWIKLRSHFYEINNCSTDSLKIDLSTNQLLTKVEFVLIAAVVWMHPQTYIEYRSVDASKQAPIN